MVGVKARLTLYFVVIPQRCFWTPPPEAFVESLGDALLPLFSGVLLPGSAAAAAAATAAMFASDTGGLCNAAAADACLRLSASCSSMSSPSSPTRSSAAPSSPSNQVSREFVDPFVPSNRTTLSVLGALPSDFGRVWRCWCVVLQKYSRFWRYAFLSSLYFDASVR